MNNTLLDSYFEAINTENWSLMTDLWTPDGVLMAVGVKPRIGRDSVLAYFPRILAGYSEHVDTPTRIVEAGDTILVEIDFVGRLRTGQPIEFGAADVFDLLGGCISRLSTWYDSQAVFQQVAAAEAERMS